MAFTQPACKAKFDSLFKKGQSTASVKSVQKDAIVQEAQRKAQEAEKRRAKWESLAKIETEKARTLKIRVAELEKQVQLNDLNSRIIDPAGMEDEELQLEISVLQTQLQGEQLKSRDLAAKNKHLESEALSLREDALLARERDAYKAELSDLGFSHENLKMKLETYMEENAKMKVTDQTLKEENARLQGILDAHQSVSTAKEEDFHTRLTGVLAKYTDAVKQLAAYRDSMKVTTETMKKDAERTQEEVLSLKKKIAALESKAMEEEQKAELAEQRTAYASGRCRLAMQRMDALKGFMTQLLQDLQYSELKVSQLQANVQSLNSVRSDQRAAMESLNQWRSVARHRLYELESCFGHLFLPTGEAELALRQGMLAGNDPNPEAMKKFTKSISTPEVPSSLPTAATPQFAARSAELRQLEADHPLEPPAPSLDPQRQDQVREKQMEASGVRGVEVSGASGQARVGSGRSPTKALDGGSSGLSFSKGSPGRWESTTSEDEISTELSVGPRIDGESCHSAAFTLTNRDQYGM